MRTLSLSEAKMKLSALVDEVYGTDQEIVITRNGVPENGRARAEGAGLPCDQRCSLYQSMASRSASSRPWR